MSDQTILPIILAGVIVGIILLVLEYRTRWFAQHLDDDVRKAKHPSFNARPKRLDKKATAVINIVPIDAKSYDWDRAAEPPKGRVVTARFELGPSSYEQAYIQEIAVGLELGVDFVKAEFDLRYLRNALLGRTLTPWTGFQRGMHEPYALGSIGWESHRVDALDRVSDLTSVSDASKVKILNSVDLQPIHLDRWIEISEHAGKYVWEVIIFLGKQWCEFLDDQTLTPRKVYLSVRIHDGRVRMAKAIVSGTVISAPEGQERILRNAILGT